MFCAQCGAQSAPGTRFCVGCGAPVAASGGPAPAPAAQFPPAMFGVSAQGVDASLRPNGSYDSQEFGSMDANRLCELLRALQGQRDFQAPPDADVCPPHVLVETPAGQRSFFKDGGRLVAEGSEQPVSPEQAVAMCLGAAPTAPTPAAPAFGGGRPGPAGFRPLRRPDVPPTDRNLDFVPDTGPAAPQVVVAAWKAGWGSQALFIAAVVGTLVMALLLFAGISSRDGAILAVGGIGFAVGLLLAILARALGRESLRIGVDWAHNALWIVHGAERPRSTPDANCIQGFRAVSSEKVTWAFDPKTIVRAKRRTKHTVFIEMVQGHKDATLSIAAETGGDAERIAAAGNGLLARL